MRDAEALRMPYDCLTTKVVTEATLDDFGVERDPGQMIKLLSTTTKLEGYEKKVSWLAPEIVRNAVTLGQYMARGLANYYGVSYVNCPLFIRASSNKKMDINPHHFDNSYNEILFDLAIVKDDLALLRASNPSRAFTQPKFDIGREWSLTSHQFRRSLAFYAASSGLVSLLSIKKQFKHHSLEMARYYSNGFENIKSVFGYYDSEEGEFVLPSSHSAFEYQLAVPISMSEKIMNDVLGSNEVMFGSTGSQAEKLRMRSKSGEIYIEDIRKETENRVKDGEMTYRETILGGCTFLGECNSFMLGDFTECLGCIGAIIQLSKVEEAIESLEQELSCYDESSGEYDLTLYEIEIFVKYRDAAIAKIQKRGLTT
jgi:hypothetical protein